MQYDIATKVLMDRAGIMMLEVFSGLKVKELELIQELPQETVSLKRSDYILKVKDSEGKKFIVVWEFLSSWKEDSILSLIDYYVRCKIKYKLKIYPVVILLKESSQAGQSYEDEHIRFIFHLTGLYKINAVSFLQEADVHLLPLIPLMEGADEEVVFTAEKRIYEANLEKHEKADLLTAMAIFAGLKDKELTLKLVKRRRDIMIESYAYEIIKQEGFEEGRVEGRVEGREEGELIRGRKSIVDVLEVLYNQLPSDVVEEINKIDDIEVLESLHKKALRLKDIDEFKTILKELD